MRIIESGEEGEVGSGRRTKIVKKNNFLSSSDSGSEEDNMGKGKNKKTKTTKKSNKKDAGNKRLNSTGSEVEKENGEVGVGGGGGKEEWTEGKKPCPHLKKGLNPADVRKKLKHPSTKLGLCDSCVKKGVEVETAPGGVWVCLNCGHQGCGRYSEGQHAKQHFEACSHAHPLSFNISSFSLGIWCYECDEEVKPESNPHLREVATQVANIYSEKGISATIPSNNGLGNITSDINNIVNRNPTIENGPKQRETDGGKFEKPATAKKGDSSENSKSKNKLQLPEGVKVRGLSNLGNTCFFNSVMQCLMQSQQLETLVREEKIKGKVVVLSPTHPPKPLPSSDSETEEASRDVVSPKQFSLEEAGPLTCSFKKFFSEYHSEDSKSSVVVPSGVFKHICSKTPRFKGYQQQDSHELLRHLLDGLKMEEKKRVQLAVLRAYNLPDNPKKDAISPELASKMQRYVDAGNPAMVEGVFGGKLIQTIRCLTCDHISQIMEPFLDLSLPIVDTKSVLRVGADGQPVTRVMRRKSRDNDSDDDLNSLLDKNKAAKPSKHKLKQQKKLARKNARTSTANSEKETENDNPTKTEEGEGDGKPDTDTQELSQEEEENIAKESVEEEEEEGSEVEDEDQHSQDEADEETLLLPKCLKELERITLQRCLEEQMAPLVDPDTMDPDPAISSVQACLRQFTGIEALTGKNKFGCENCARLGKGEPPPGTGKAGKDKPKPPSTSPKVAYSDATKNYLIYSPPAILTLHLKRFQSMGFMSRKLSKIIRFPLTLDIAPFCSAKSERIQYAQKQILYSLFGVVSHSGSLHGGHYVAYVKIRDRNEKLSRHFLLSTLNNHNNQTSGLPNGVQVSPAIPNGHVAAEVQSSVIESEEAASSEAAQHSEPPLANGESSLNEFKPNVAKWYYISDGHVSEVPESRVQSAEAYLLFYERLK